MRASTLISFIVIVLLGFSTMVQAGELSWHAEGENGALVGGGKGGVATGLEILQKGGNAIDAAAGTILALSVTDYHAYFCFGGEVPIIVYDARRGVVEVLCGQGAAPALATPEYFEKYGNTVDEGPEAWAVPGVLDACLTALSRYGTMSFTEVTVPMLRILDRGEEDWHTRFAGTIRRLVKAEKGARDRKRGLRLVADYFYRGPIAREIDKWSCENGGLMRYSDLARHATRIEEPIMLNYRGHTVCKCGPWSQGPVLLQTLRLLDGYELAEMGHNSADYIHVITEAMKLAYADRDVYYGDPWFVDVPLDELLSAEYTRIRRDLIDMKHASLIQRPGVPAAMKALLSGFNAPFGKGGIEHDTTNCVVADRWGNVVATTPSGAGGGEVGNTGIMMGNRLECFNIWKGHPNCIEGGKRPRTTLTPTLVLKDGKAVAAVNIAGGDLQDQSTLQLLLNFIDFGMLPKECIEPPRFSTGHYVGSFNQPKPRLGSLTVHEDVGEDVIEELKARGHKLRVTDGPGSHDVILTYDPETGVIRAAGDPKTERHAAAF
ncbi:gamma-glutamyltransferase family protein [Planctomycetota bacterium]